MSSTTLKSKDGKFIGGAAVARKKATIRRVATPILNPMQRQRAAEYSSQVLSIKMNPMERFFAALFRSIPQQFTDSHRNPAARAALLHQITHRVGLQPPTQQVTHFHYKAHTAALASLVIEEARHAVAEALCQTKRPPSISVRLSSTRGLTPHDVLFFRKATDFTLQQLHDIRPGTVFSIQQTDNSKIIIGTVVNFTERTSDSHVDLDDVLPPNTVRRSIALMIYQNVKMTVGDYHIAPLTGLITQVRQFEACTPYNLLGVPFLPSLMGHKGSTHIKFDLQNEFNDDDDENDNDDDESHVNNENVNDKNNVVLRDFQSNNTVHVKSETKSGKVKPKEKTEQDTKSIRHSPATCATPSIGTYSDPDIFSIPTLNEMQETACLSFLNSKSASITLVQGPPGTGKTTLLIATLCRYLLQSEGKKRLMVCAPTNKAVTVLASRFLYASRRGTDFNIVMIGDKEKLLTEDQPGLCGIFAYTFIEIMINEWARIRQVLNNNEMNVEALITTAKCLVGKLENQLPILDGINGLPEMTGEIMRKLVELFSSGPTGQIGVMLKKTLRETIDQLIKTLARINERDVTAELLSSAHIIFCTLASAGAVMLKQTCPIDDLIVDEAAAATEPELYIPFHLKPQRLLAVGDPKQLPATVMSRCAEKWGLNKSLHERLMYDCKMPYIMLNVQYRMRPAIGAFPSKSFYGGEIQNGPNVMDPNYNTSISLMENEAYSFIQVIGSETQSHTGSYQNREEAKIVVDIILVLGNLARMKSVGKAWCSVDRIRIITFYQAQVTLIKSMLRVQGLESVVVSTVDSSQGCEADVVIVTFVRSVKNCKEGGNKVGFLADNRRLNVALTRAKFQLICVGNADGMMKLDEAKTIQALAQDAHARDCLANHQAILMHNPNGNQHRNQGPVGLDRNWKKMQANGEHKHIITSDSITNKKHGKRPHRGGPRTNDSNKRVKQSPSLLDLQINQSGRH